MRKNYYVVYEGDKPMGVFENIFDVANHFGVTLTTAQYWLSPKCRERISRTKFHRGRLIEKVWIYV